MPEDEDDKKSDARNALGVAEDAGTRTIQAQFRRKAKALQSGTSATVRSKKSFEELNEAYKVLMQDRKKAQGLPTKNVAILSSDVANWSGMMAANEQETLEFFNLCKDVFEEIVDKHQGRVFNTAGDAILVEFEYVFNAIHCAVEIQKELRAINLGQPEGKKVLFRMGINKGEVFLQGTDLLGDAVNLAARIQTSAKPGGICLSGEIHDLVANKVQHSFTSLGKVNYKNIPEPVRTYALIEDDGKFKPPIPSATKLSAIETPTLEKRPAKKAKSSSAGVGGALLLALATVAGGLYFWQFQSSTQAPSRGKPAVATPAAGEAELGTVDVQTNPSLAEVTFVLDGTTVLQRKSPVNERLKAGRYKVRIVDTALGISEDSELVVEPGKVARLSRDFHAAGTGQAAAGQAGVLTVAADSPLSPQEQADKLEVGRGGDPQGTFNLGKRYLDKGALRDAYDLLLISAKGANGQAQLEIGKMFLDGKGAPVQSFDASIYWLLMAARNGISNATVVLATNRAKFPEDYRIYIDNQHSIDAKKTGSARMAEAQKEFLDSLKDKLVSQQLPN